MSNPQITLQQEQQPLLVPEDQPALPKQVSLFNGHIILNPTISKVNFYTYLVHACFGGIIMIPMGLLQSPLFENVYKLDAKEMNNLSSVSTAIAVILKLLFAPLLGYICDKYGRKFLVGFGAIITSATIFMMPGIPSVYPWYYILLALQDLALMCLMAAPLLADYIDYETKGRMAGIVGAMVHLTSFIATFLNENVDLTKNVPFKYRELGITGTFIGCILMIGLKGGAYHKKLFYDHKAIQAKKNLAEKCPEAFDQIVSVESYLENYDGKVGNDQENVGENIKRETTRSTTNDIQNKGIVLHRSQMNINPSVETDEGERNQALLSMAAEKNFKPGFMAGLREARNPWVLTGFICSFMMVCNTGLLNYILVTYCKSLGSNANQAIALNNKHLLVGIFAGVFFGFFADKYNKFKLVIISLLTAITGILLLIFTPSAYNAMAYGSMCLFGFSISGFVTLSGQLQSKYANAKYRASVSSVSSVISVLGTLLISILGVYLMNYDVRAPFYIFLAANVIALFILAFLYSSKKEILNRL